MKKTTKFISAALAAALCAGLLAGCNSASSSSGSTSASGSASASSSTSASAESIDYSKGLAENGHIDGVTALDYVTLPADYAAIPLAAGTADVSDEDVQAQIDSIMAQYAKPEQITDRAIEDGDQVNIDYSGSIDGEKFDGGTASSQSVQCCFSKRMRKVFRKNEKSMLQNCNKKAKRKGRLQRVKKPM